MKRKNVYWLVGLILAGILLAGWLWFSRTYIIIDSRLIRRDSTSLTLSGEALPEKESLLALSGLEILDMRSVALTAEEYDALHQALPECQILWQVPFQDSAIPHDAKELALSSLTADDLKVFPYLPNLERVNAEACRDYDVLMMLKAQYPLLDIRYSATVNGKTYSHETAPDVTQLTLHNAHIPELAQALPCFTQLEEVVFTGIAPENDVIYELMCRYPEISFAWELEVCGIKTSNTVTTLILSDIPMEDTSEVESHLKYFPNLERVEMCNCGIPSEEMGALAQRHPDIRFVWAIQIGMGTLRTDAIAFIPYKLGHTMYKPLHDSDCTELKYCTDLICLDMGHMDIHDFSFLEYMPNMKYLIVADTPCKDFSSIAKLKELIYLEIFCTDFTQYEILLELTNLQDLNLGTTPPADVEVLKQMTWLKRLWLPGVKIYSAQMQELYEALPDTRIVFFAEHSTDNGWRNHKNYRDMRDLLGMFYMD